MKQKNETKVQIYGEAKARLERYASQLKERGKKRVDLGEIVSEVIAHADERFFEKKIEEATPIEFKIRQFLEDENKKIELEAFLGRKKRVRRVAESPIKVAQSSEVTPA